MEHIGIRSSRPCRAGAPVLRKNHLCDHQRCCGPTITNCCFDSGCVPGAVRGAQRPRDMSSIGAGAWAASQRRPQQPGVPVGRPPRRPAGPGEPPPAVCQQEPYASSSELWCCGVSSRASDLRKKSVPPAFLLPAHRQLRKPWSYVPRCEREGTYVNAFYLVCCGELLADPSLLCSPRCLQKRLSHHINTEPN